MVLLRKLDAELKNGIRWYRVIAFTSVMSCVILRLEREKNPARSKQLHVVRERGVDGKGCQHSQVMIAQLSQQQWEWQEDGKKVTWQQGGDLRPTMYVASLNIGVF